MPSKYPHYVKNVSHLETIDVYRVLELWGVTSPPIQHAIKKLLVAGGRGVKSREKDLYEAIDSVHRAIAMDKEDDKISNKSEGSGGQPISSGSEVGHIRVGVPSVHPFRIDDSQDVVQKRTIQQSSSRSQDERTPDGFPFSVS